jgi:hypothetical protein
VRAYGNTKGLHCFKNAYFALLIRHLRVQNVNDVRHIRAVRKGGQMGEWILVMDNGWSDKGKKSPNLESVGFLGHVCRLPRQNPFMLKKM